MDNLCMTIKLLESYPLACEYSSPISSVGQDPCESQDTTCTDEACNGNGFVNLQAGLITNGELDAERQKTRMCEKQELMFNLGIPPTLNSANRFYTQDKGSSYMNHRLDFETEKKS
ncbi:hypothetical protein ACROYT_G013477 [Oculina patagonica]